MTLTIAHYVFTQEEIQELRTYQEKQRDGRLRDRFTALFMLADEIAIDPAARLVGKTVKTIEHWGAKYLTYGIASLNSFNYKPKQTYLKPPQIEQLVAWVKETNPANTKQVKAYIKKQFKVAYTVEAVRQLLHKHGLKRIRPKVQPGDPPSEDEQRGFVTQYDTMKAESEPGTVFLFGDAMHLVHQNEPGYCWGDPKDPPIIKTNSGRKRLNILGAYNPATHSLVHLTGEANCDALRAIEFFDIVEKTYLSAPKIVLFVDNAKYFKATLVEEWLTTHPRLQVEPLPAYAPNLNLIERFWKFAKEILVKNTYYEKYKTFRAHVFRFLNHVDDYVDELRTLMVEKFQIIPKKTASC
jgi:transposase